MTNMFYHTARGKAVLAIDGKRLKTLGNFPTESEAKAACEAHFKKAARAADNFKRQRPVAFFM